MKIYTGTGDKGKTSLFSGERVIKYDIQVEAYGELDELNAIIGVLAASVPEQMNEIRKWLRGIQSDLLHIGSWLATRPDTPAVDDLKPITSVAWKTIEGLIDQLQNELPQLKSFILPGGAMSAAMAHLARTVCRRTERRVLALNDQSHLFGGLESMPHILVYLNRLSDYFFVLARYLNINTQNDEIPWQK